MHIPENYLSPQTCGVIAVAMVPVWVRAARHMREEVPARRCRSWAWPPRSASSR